MPLPSRLLIQAVHEFRAAAQDRYQRNNAAKTVRALYNGALTRRADFLKTSALVLEQSTAGFALRSVCGSLRLQKLQHALRTDLIQKQRETELRFRAAEIKRLRSGKRISTETATAIYNHVVEESQRLITDARQGRA